MLASTRLPGIQFDVVAPPAPQALVRMDIAVFVGFAASGPLHQPVAVEDIVHFQDIFGSDLVIASDAATNQSVYACLPSAVRAFFRNGGSRCWVVRVADQKTAQANRFPIPGLYNLQSNSTSQAYGYARSEGSWSDSLAVGTALRSLSIAVASFTGDPHAVDLWLANSNDVVPGDLLKFSFGDPRNALWFFVDGVTTVTAASPPLGPKRGRLVTVTGANVYWQLEGSPPSPQGFPVCERVSMDLFVHSDSQAWSLTDLGFAPLHPRYWAPLPTDAVLYALDAPEGLAAEALQPRFPLAVMNGAYPADFYLPLGIGPLPDQFAGPDLSGAQDAVIRDGVANFDSSLFLDPSLAGSTSIDLLNEAYYIQYQSPQPRNLIGIHAALAIDEATIIAVPDAIQRGWFQVQSMPLASPPESSPVAHPEWWHFLDCNQQQAVPISDAPPLGQFEPCNLLIIDPPLLSISDVDAGRYSLTWNPLADAVDSLEESLDPGFATSNVIYEGSSGKVTLYNRPPGDYYYRIKRQIGAASSNYSNGVGFRVAGTTGWQSYPATEYQNDTLLTLHQALLRLCAARGDMFAVLAMPQHYRESEAMTHATELKSALSAAEPNVYSFGALYHPWLIGREEDDLLNMRTTPPDGSMAGVMATRSSQRGPWISPANEPLHGVVDLTPLVLKSSRQELQDAQINLIRQEPSGFICLCELTLSDNPDLSPINVRRLMSFLRKTVLQAGVDYVFEPNSDEFRRGVQRGFEALFDRLLQLGAFAGRTSSDSFQVDTSSSVNTPQAMDNGQFFVEIRVAPSVPMRFLTIRLLQTADRTSVTEGG
jgi:hypothetical protein